MHYLFFVVPFHLEKIASFPIECTFQNKICFYSQKKIIETLDAVTSQVCLNFFVKTLLLISGFKYAMLKLLATSHLSDIKLALAVSEINNIFHHNSYCKKH